MGVRRKGSSPLARGLRNGSPTPCANRRIIPARAGFTLHHLDGRPRARDHPRSRGVYVRVALRVSRLLGSSPLARGLQAVLTARQWADGIIPARAGFTGTGMPSTSSRRDHPRSRGVYSVAAAKTGAGDRIIPARAGFTATSAEAWRRGADHPRSRGVYTMTTTRALRAAGSSPLARGLPARMGGGGAGRGIIPARAGFTGSRPAAPGQRWDHPRSRGVYAESAPAIAPGLGSSPLARGLRMVATDSSRSSGIIPARAGFTTRRSLSPPPTQGSSPLARGLPHPAQPRRLLGGIIPARAGFTEYWNFVPPRVGDHPRSRGVYSAGYAFEGVVSGSSPLARGLQGADHAPQVENGIIPARAGFTQSRAEVCVKDRDHPRSRGVYHKYPQLAAATEGSSPLARGLPAVVARPGARRGIIPARAGFTFRGVFFPVDYEDHPRSRGVYAALGGGCEAGQGSSPLARGLLARPAGGGGSRRIIPARAGFTLPGHSLAVR